MLLLKRRLTNFLINTFSTGCVKLYILHKHNVNYLIIITFVKAIKLIIYI